MFETLFAKTFSVLGLQLIITFLSTVAVLKFFRQMYEDKTPGISADYNENGELDLHIDWSFIKPYFWWLLVLDILLFIILLIWGQNNISIGLPIFSLWSIVTGIEVAFALISVDENLGIRILGITASITVICAIVAIYSGIDFSFLSGFLFIALLILLVANMLRLFVSMGRWKERIIAFFGVIIFTGYLLFDFNRLENLKESGINTWSVATNLSIDIYLDIINLFLELLDLLSN
ncbi:MAG: Bax inhibitor-1 family protein [Deltaproteobacteria bacterium]